jgi:hypothetical protein
MLWRFLVENSDVRIAQPPASTAPEEATEEDFVRQPPKSKSLEVIRALMCTLLIEGAGINFITIF